MGKRRKGIERRRGLKVNVNKSKVRVLNGEDRLECEVIVDWVQLEHVSEFKYLGTDEAECHSKVPSRQRVAGAIRHLVNVMGLHRECAMVLCETLIIPVLMYGSEKLIWKKKEWSRIRAVYMDNPRGVLGIRRIDTGAIRHLLNVMGLHHECAMVLCETLLIPVLMYGSEKLIWKKKEWSRIRAVCMDNLRSVLGIRRIDTVSNAWIRELFGLMKE